MKKIKIAAGVVTVIFCMLLGCQKREKEEELLFLDMEAQQEASEELAESAQAEEITGKENMEVQTQQTVEPPQSQGEKETEICVVHICGAVNKPGVYTMKMGDRIYQAIEQAGGFAAEAKQDYLNQADLLADGMKIYVPTCEEVEQDGADESWKLGGAPETSAVSAGETLVNINTADETLLCTLPGIGSSKAKSILAYRDKNGAFQSIEDIMNVEGIKEGMFQKIRDSITV